MNIEMLEMSPMPVSAKSFELHLGGKCIGDVKPIQLTGGDVRYLACLHIVGGSSIGNAYGHGSSREEAIRNAFISGRKEAEQFLAGISHLESAVYGEAEVLSDV